MIRALSSILDILIHFNFEDLFIQREEELIEIRTNTASFIQHLFSPNIDVKTLNPSIEKLIEETICAKLICTDSTEIFEFRNIYNNKQCFNLFLVVEILFDICKDMNITLQNLDKILYSKNIPQELERNIKKQLYLHEFSDDDLYNTANTVFTDLLFEGLNLCVPTYQKEGKTNHYELKLKTILQGLYFHLYQYSGELKFCLYCNTLFESTNKRKKYCSNDCGNKMRSNRSYHKNKKSSQ